ncbi:MAG TPA: DUF2142 domain-containing protein [Solirubrobacteraceae bacterium]|nr:DUF2142 domain-containing protein [Solirubrobacteraceae bacterium]
MSRLRRARSAVFAGDPRIWRAAALVALPLLVLSIVYCLVPRDYFTGTNSVEPLTFVAPAPAGQATCVTGLLLPPGTAGIRLQAISRSSERPALRFRALIGGTLVDDRLPAARVGASRVSEVDFPLPKLEPSALERPVSACVTADEEINWGGTPLPAPPASYPPTLAGHPIAARIAAWYLPPKGRRASYLARLGAILDRAALFRPGLVGPWTYWLILFGILPLLAFLALRLLARASAHATRPIPVRRVAVSLFAIAAANFACWALITPVFQAPDEVDHFAYTQSLVERGEQPAASPASPLTRWSRSEGLLLEDSGFATDHQTGSSRVPWDPRTESQWRRDVRVQRPSGGDGGGNETAATHGPLYYGALAPAYAIASSSPLDELTLMRLTSALIGAIAVLAAFLLARELAPARPALAVIAALLVAFQPMYGFISGAVNNDVGVNAATALLELLTVLVLRRGWRLRLVIPLGVLLLAIPAIKETGLAVYPVVGLALVAALWRHRRRADLAGAGALAAAAVATRLALSQLKDGLRPAAVAVAAGAGPAITAGSSVAEAEHHPFGYLAYLWEVFLPRLPFMARHFETASPPAFLIFVERGWGAFGWYDVLFPKWVFYCVFAVMLAVAIAAVAAARRERAFLRRNLPEAVFLALCPVAVVAGIEAAFYTPGIRSVVAEFGRYVFPAIVPLSLLVVGALHGFGRRAVPLLGAGLVTAMIALSATGQLLTLTSFYA